MTSAQHEQGTYGYGCQLANVYGKQAVEHDGALVSGFRTNLMYFPEDELTFVVLSNNLCSGVQEVRDVLIAHTFEKPYELSIKTPPSCYRETWERKQ